jgi:hypothetical protein
MNIARTCDDRVDELKAQHAAAIIANQTTIAKLEDAAAAEKRQTAALVAANAVLVAQVAALQGQAALKLSDIHAAIAARQTLEIHPVRPDHRQFAEWHTGPVPALPTPLPLPPPPPSAAFDLVWCTADCGSTWKVEIEASCSRAHAAKTGDRCLTLRSAAPLQPRPAQQEKDQLPAYRVVVEAYGRYQSCRLGFVPSHHMHKSGAVTAVIPAAGHSIWNYGGWSIEVSSRSSQVGSTLWSGWVALEPLWYCAAGGAGCKTSEYATTSKVPPVPAGSAVEFAMAYAAGTCRVAFYTPAAVAGRFVEAPYAKMELRFVANEKCDITPR